MKCPHCGFTGSDEAATCGKCAGDLAQARQALGLASPHRPPRASTPILDGPVDPSLIDDAPPGPEKTVASSILDLEAGWPDTFAEETPRPPAREETNLDEILAGADPVEPEDVSGTDRPRASGTRSTAPGDVVPRSPAPAAQVAGAAEEVIDLGEPIEIEETHATLPPSLRNLGDWPEDEWESAEGNIPSTADPRALPKGGFWLRVVASMADSIFIQIVSSIIVFAVATASGAIAVMGSHLPPPGTDPAAAAEEIEQAILPFLTGPLGWTFLALITLASLYRPVCHWRWGKTLGKKLVGLRVVTGEGQNPSFVRACWRDIAYLVASLPLGLGLLWVVWDPQKQGWHDKLAGTYVLKENT